MASRVFSKTKHPYHSATSLKRSPGVPTTTYTPKIPSPRSALILCAVVETSAAFLSVLENFSPEASCGGERHEGVGVRRGLIDEKAGEGGLTSSPSMGDNGNA